MGVDDGVVVMVDVVGPRVVGIDVVVGDAFVYNVIGAGGFSTVVVWCTFDVVIADLVRTGIVGAGDSHSDLIVMFMYCIMCAYRYIDSSNRYNISI